MVTEDTLENRYKTCREIFVTNEQFGGYTEMRAEKRQSQMNWTIGIIVVVLLSFLSWAASTTSTLSDHGSSIKRVEKKTDALNKEISKKLDRIERAVTRE